MIIFQSILFKAWQYIRSWDNVYCMMTSWHGKVIRTTDLVAPLKFGNGWAILYHILLGMWLVIHAGIQVNPC